MEFNNREIAILIWISAFLGYVLLKDKDGKTAEAVKGLFRVLLAPKIIVVLMWAALWIILCIQALSYIGAWDVSNLKTTLLWALTFAFVTLFDVRRISEDQTYFRRTVRDTVSATVVITFIAEAYSFPLIAELILIPLLALMTGVQVVSEKNSEHASVNKLTSTILAATGLVYIGYGIYMATMNFSEFATWSTLREFVIPIALSLLYLPYLFIVTVLVTYELTFVGLRWALKDDALRRYAVAQAIFKFRSDLDGLRRWKRHIGIFRPSSKDEIRSSIAEIKANQNRERNPSPVPPEHGWCPIAAKKFLEDQALPTGDYHRLDDGRWCASSPMRELDKTAIQPDNIAFYIEGDASAVKRMKVVLNVNDGSIVNMSELEFQVICIDLLGSILKEVPQELKEQISRSNIIDVCIEDRRIRVQKEDFANRAKAYSRKLIVDYRPSTLDASGISGN